MSPGCPNTPRAESRGGTSGASGRLQGPVYLPIRVTLTPGQGLVSDGGVTSTPEARGLGSGSGHGSGGATDPGECRYTGVSPTLVVRRLVVVEVTAVLLAPPGPVRDGQGLRLVAVDPRPPRRLGRPVGVDVPLSGPWAGRRNLGGEAGYGPPPGPPPAPGSQGSSDRT